MKRQNKAFLELDDSLFFKTTKARGRQEQESDVSIAIRKGQYALTFRDESATIAFDGAGYGRLAIVQKRMYFKAANSVEGYKIRKKSATSKTSELSLTTSTPSTREALNKTGILPVGDYELKFDQLYRLYYIECEELCTLRD